MSAFNGDNEFRGGDTQFIANGIFGDVFRVQRDDLPDKCCAVKRSKRMQASRFQRESILREVRSMQTLCTARFPHVVAYHEHWESGDRVYIQMSFEAKGSMRELVKTSFFPDQSILHIIHDVCCALQYMHEVHQLVHLDLKPSNLLITIDGHLKLCDFGKTVGIGSPSDDDEGDTRYMARELLDCRTYVPSADMYSLGDMAFELCFANVGPDLLPQPLPFELLPESGESWHLLRNGAAPLPTFRLAALVDLVRGMMAPEPAVRPTAGAMLGVAVVAAAKAYCDPLLLSSPTFIPVTFREQRSDSFEPLMALDC